MTTDLAEPTRINDWVNTPRNLVRGRGNWLAVSWTVARKDLRENLKSRHFQLFSLLCAAMVVVSLIIQARIYGAQWERYDNGVKHATEMVVLTKPNPLAMAARGLEETITASYDVGYPVSPITVGGTQRTISPVFGLIPMPDVSYLIRILLSLGALLLSYDLITREKEGGTLRLLFVAGFSRAQILFGKWLGVVMALLALMASMAALWMGLLSFVRRTQLSPDDWLRLGGIWATGFLYICIFATLGLWFSAWAERSIRSLALSLQTWLMLVILIPQMSHLLARSMIPLADRLEVDRLIGAERMKNIRLGKEFAGRIPSDDQEAITRVFVEYEGRTARFTEQVERTRMSDLSRLERLSTNLSRLSPAGCVQLAMTAMAETGPATVAKQRQELLDFKHLMNDAVFFNRLAKQDDVRPLPRFETERSGGLQSLGAAITDAPLLAGYLLIAYVAALVAIRRMDVR